MSAELIVYISLAIFTLPFLWFIYKITTSNFLYDESKGTWKKGINLTSLHAEPGDVIEHYWYKLYVGIALLILIVVTDILTIWLFNEITVKNITEQEINIIVIKYMIYLSIGLIIPIIMLYGSWKERYIQRKSSTPPKSHKIAVRICVASLILLALCLIPFL